MVNTARIFSLGILLASPLTALATSPSGAVSWAIQDTGVTASSNSHVGVTLRDGVWPTIIVDYSPASIYSLFPAGKTNGSTAPGTGAWQSLGSSFITSSGYIHTASSSTTGQFAYVIPSPSSYGTSINGGISGGGTIKPVTAGTQAVAFDAAGTLYTATNTAISNAPALPSGFVYGSICDLAVSPYGDIGFVASSGSQIQFAEYNHWLHSWSSSIVYFSSAETLNSASLNLEYDSRGIPHILGASGRSLVALDFSVMTNTWSPTTIFTASSTPLSTLATLAANDSDTIGTVYSDGSTLYYASKEGSANWQTSAIPTGTTVLAAGGLTYDNAGLPVVGFVGNTGHAMVAYDPVTVPEPAALGLLAVGALALLKRRR